jgi:hypothetical protein
MCTDTRIYPSISYFIDRGSNLPALTVCFPDIQGTERPFSNEKRPKQQLVDFVRKAYMRKVALKTKNNKLLSRSVQDPKNSAPGRLIFDVLTPYTKNACQSQSFSQ